MIQILFFCISDIDECVNKTDKCDENAVCNNTEASYNCSCNMGYEGDGFNCTGIESVNIFLQQVVEGLTLTKSFKIKQAK